MHTHTHTMATEVMGGDKDKSNLCIIDNNDKSDFDVELTCDGELYKSLNVFFQTKKQIAPNGLTVTDLKKYLTINQNSFQYEKRNIYTGSMTDNEFIFCNCNFFILRLIRVQQDKTEEYVVVDKPASEPVNKSTSTNDYTTDFEPVAKDFELTVIKKDDPSKNSHDDITLTNNGCLYRYSGLGTNYSLALVKRTLEGNKNDTSVFTINIHHSNTYLLFLRYYNKFHDVMFTLDFYKDTTTVSKPSNTEITIHYDKPVSEPTIKDTITKLQNDVNYLMDKIKSQQTYLEKLTDKANAKRIPNEHLINFKSMLNLFSNKQNYIHLHEFIFKKYVRSDDPEFYNLYKDQHNYLTELQEKFCEVVKERIAEEVRASGGTYMINRKNDHIGIPYIILFEEYCNWLSGAGFNVISFDITKNKSFNWNTDSDLKHVKAGEQYFTFSDVKYIDDNSRGPSVYKVDYGVHTVDTNDNETYALFNLICDAKTIHTCKKDLNY